MSDATQTRQNRPFSRFEFMVAWRYLRARRQEAFISVIAALTLTGIAIGVATLIVVMSVMNGFRAELLDKILGLNGHFTAFPIEEHFEDFDKVIPKLRVSMALKRLSLSPKGRRWPLALAVPLVSLCAASTSATSKRCLYLRNPPFWVALIIGMKARAWPSACAWHKILVSLSAIA